MSFFDGLSSLFSALMSGDSFMIADALIHPAVYAIAAVLIPILAYLLMRLMRAVPILDRYLEKTVLVSTYLLIAAIIFVEVIRRFVFQVQAPWSTTLPPYLFLIMTWVGCAYNVRLRTHLSFSELRVNLPRPLQMACLSLDAILWLVFAWIVIVTTMRQTSNSASNFQILLGTDNVMQWWFYICVPLSWLLLSARAIENWLEDIARYRSDEPLIRQAAIGGE